MNSTTPFDFDSDLLVCSGLSIEHADGSTECEHDCGLPHDLHFHVAGCGEFGLVCSCNPDENLAGSWLLAA